MSYQVKNQLYGEYVRHLTSFYLVNEEPVQIVQHKIGHDLELMYFLGIGVDLPPPPKNLHRPQIF